MEVTLYSTIPDSGPVNIVAVGRSTCPEKFLGLTGKLMEKPTISGATLALLVSTIVVILAVSTRRNQVKSCGIPVAFSLPWVGNLSLLRGLPHVVVTRLAKTYGKIFRLDAGGDRSFVILNDIELVRNAMRHFPSALTGKPQTTTTKMTNAGAQQDMGQRWNRRRHITMTAIKSLFRETPEVLQDVCESELKRLVDTINTHLGAEVDPTDDITTFVARTMWRLIYGRGQDPDEETARQCKQLAAHMDDYTKNAGPFCILDRFPFVKKLVSRSLGQYQAAVRFMNTFCETNESQRHTEQDKYSGPHADIMGFLMRGSRALTEEDRERLQLSEELLYKGIGDLVRAGTESPSLLIIWICLMLANHHRVQDRMVAEIRADTTDEVVYDVGVDRLPYTQAVVYETVRFCSIVPFLKRRTLDRVVVGDHTLPAGTDIIINNHAISHDAERWTDPETFRPERFLREDGSFDMSVLENFLPYGIGKRRCMGEELGRLIPFAAIATIVSNFHIASADGRPLSMEPSFGITLTPQRHKLRFTPRLGSGKSESFQAN